MMKRLVRARDGWWCMTAGKVAHLPEEAAVDGILQPDAERALNELGFFDLTAATYAVTVLAATSCNLGCNYCFQNLGQAEAANAFAPPRIARHLLEPNTIRRIRTFVEQRMADTSATDLTLLVFGGEPLLNARGVELLLQTLRPVGMSSAQMVSNAVLLTPDIARPSTGLGSRGSKSLSTATARTTIESESTMPVVARLTRS